MSKALEIGRGERARRSGGRFRVGVPGGRGAHACCLAQKGATGMRRTARSAAAALSLAHESDPAAASDGDHGGLRIAFAAGFVCGQEGRAQHRIARFWARAVVWGTGCSTHGARDGEPAQPAGGRLCVEPYVVHGYAGDLCRAALPVSHSGEEGAVADRHSSDGIWTVQGRFRSIPRTRTPRSPAWARA